MADNILAYFRMARKTLRKRKDRKTKTRRMKGGGSILYAHRNFEKYTGTHVRLKLEGDFIPFDADKDGKDGQGYSKYLLENKDKDQCYEIYEATTASGETIVDTNGIKRYIQNNEIYYKPDNPVYVGKFVGLIDGNYRAIFSRKKGPHGTDLHLSDKYIFESPSLDQHSAAQEFNKLGYALMNTHHVSSWHIIKKTPCMPYFKTKGESRSALTYIDKFMEIYMHARNSASDAYVKGYDDMYCNFLNENKDKCFEGTVFTDTVPLFGGERYKATPWKYLGKFISYVPAKIFQWNRREVGRYIFENYSITHNYALREVKCRMSVPPIPAVLEAEPVRAAEPAGPLSLGWTPVTVYKCGDKSEANPTTICSAKVAPAPAAAAAALPKGWEAVTENGETWYECTANPSRSTQWEKPTVPC